MTTPIRHGCSLSPGRSLRCVSAIQRRLQQQQGGRQQLSQVACVTCTCSPEISGLAICHARAEHFSKRRSHGTRTHHVVLPVQRRA